MCQADDAAKCTDGVAPDGALQSDNGADAVVRIVVQFLNNRADAHDNQFLHCDETNPTGSGVAFHSGARDALREAAKQIEGDLITNRKQLPADGIYELGDWE